MIGKFAILRVQNNMNSDDNNFYAVSPKRGFGILEILVFLFVGLCLCLAGCGEEQIKLKPGPVIGDVIKTWEDEKQANQEDRESNVKTREQIQPIVEERESDRSLQNALMAISAEVNVSDNELREVSAQKLSFDVIRNWKKIDGQSYSAMRVQGNIFNEKSLEQLAYLRSPLNISVGDDDEFKRYALELDDSKDLEIADPSPIIIVAEKGIYIDEKTSLETRGRELYLISPTIVINGRLSLQPNQVEANQSGDSAGDLHLHCVNLRLGPKNIFNLKGGDAGWIYYQELSDLELKDMAQSEAEERYNEWVSLSSWEEKRAQESATSELSPSEVDPALIVQAWQQAYDQLKAEDQDHLERDLSAAQIIDQQKPTITRELPVFHLVETSSNSSDENQMHIPLSRDFYDLAGGSSGNLFLEAYSSAGNLNYQNDPGRSRSSQMDSRRTSFVGSYVYAANVEAELKIGFSIRYDRINSQKGHGDGEVSNYRSSQFVGNFESKLFKLEESLIPYDAIFDLHSDLSGASAQMILRGKIHDLIEEILKDREAGSDSENALFSVSSERLPASISLPAALMKARGLKDSQK